MRYTPGLQLQRQLNYTKCLVALLPLVVPNVQNRALNKRKFDSNPRFGPDWLRFVHISKSSANNFTQINSV